MTYTVKSEMKYTDVENLNAITVPYEIESVAHIELKGDLRKDPVTLPIAAQELPEKSEPKLAANEYIAQSFSAPNGEGVVDLNQREIEVKTFYGEIEVNEVTEDFFTVGDEK